MIDIDFFNFAKMLEYNPARFMTIGICVILFYSLRGLHDGLGITVFLARIREHKLKALDRAKDSSKGLEYDFYVRLSEESHFRRITRFVGSTEVRRRIQEAYMTGKLTPYQLRESINSFYINNEGLLDVRVPRSWNVLSWIMFFVSLFCFFAATWILSRVKEVYAAAQQDIANGIAAVIALIMCLLFAGLTLKAFSAIRVRAATKRDLKNTHPPKTA